MKVGFDINDSQTQPNTDASRDTCTRKCTQRRSSWRCIRKQVAVSELVRRPASDGDAAS